MAPKGTGDEEAEAKLAYGKSFALKQDASIIDKAIAGSYNIWSDEPLLPPLASSSASPVYGHPSTSINTGDYYPSSVDNPSQWNMDRTSLIKYLERIRP